MTDRANVAATLHRHLCDHDWHGYTQGARWGDGEGVCEVTVDGKKYQVEQGDRDCSSSVIECWRVALDGTPGREALDAATYTGNMKQAFLKTGYFEWKPMSFVAQRGDIYLNQTHHTAMCQSAVPDILSEFSISENGTIYGQTGDQTGRESLVRDYYDYPWDGILHYTGKADNLAGSSTATTGKTVSQIAQEVIEGKWGNGSERNTKLKAAGYDPTTVQQKVNELMSAKNGWEEVSNAWYYYKNGVKQKGWQQVNGEWYYLDDAGKMRTGWIKSGGKWYWLNSSGQMAKGCVLKINGENYAFGADGSMKTGSVPVADSGALILS